MNEQAPVRKRAPGAPLGGRSVRVFHIIPHEGKFFAQLVAAMSSVSGAESRFVLYPKFRGLGLAIDLPPSASMPETEAEFETTLSAASEWADVVIVHGMTPQAGRALSRLPEKTLARIAIVWSIWGFDLRHSDSEFHEGQFLPMTWVEMARSRKIGFWRRVPSAGPPWSGPRAGIAGRIDHALYWGLGGPHAQEVARRLRLRATETPPDWLQALAPWIDLYCSLEPQSEVETNLRGFRGAFSDGFPYYTLEGMIDDTTGGDRRGVLVGGRAQPESNHLDALAMLDGKLPDEARIFLPLSYGNPDYGDMIARHAHRIFGDRARPIREWMSLADYGRLMSQTDIAVMNQVRGQAFGTEILLMARGAKLFLRPDNLHARYYRRAGYALGEIRAEGLCDTPSQQEVAENQRLLMTHWSDAAVRHRIEAILAAALEHRP